MRTFFASPFLAAAILVTWSAPSARSQCGLWDPAIGNPGMTQGGVGATPSVHCSAIYDDGSGPKLYVGGYFGAAGGNIVNFVARRDGSSWSALGTGLGWAAFCMAVYDDGTGPALYVGGQFSTAGGVPAVGIAKWNGIAWSAVGSGLSAGAVVYGMTVSSVGGVNSLFVTGTFSQAGGQTVNCIARWDPAGWHAMGTGVSVGYALTTYDADGAGPQPPKLILGGSFSTAGGVPAKGIAAWDGTTWSALGTGLGPGGMLVRALAVHDEGQGPALFVAGNFTSVAGGTLPAKNVARWKNNTWSALGDGFNGVAYALVVHNDGAGPAICAAGAFLQPGTGVGKLQYVARWSGSAWQELGLGIDSAGGAPSAHTLCSYTDALGPALFAGGSFISVNAGRSVERVATWRGNISALRYCTAKVNSLGCTPAIGWTGNASATATSGFAVKATQVRNNKSGLLFYSTTGRAATAFQGGTLCTKAPVKRTPAVGSGGTPLPVNDCSGVYLIDMNAFARGLLGGGPAPALSIPGTVVDAQWWGRDPGFPAPNNTTLSDAVEYAVCP